MAHPALIEAVRRRTEETVAEVWAEARAEAERCRTEAQGDVDRKRAVPEKIGCVIESRVRALVAAGMPRV